MFHSGLKDDKQPLRKSSFWGIRCESGKKYSQIVNQKYHISMAALDPSSVKNGKEVVSLVVERDGSEFLLCNLQKDSVLQANLNLFFDKGEKVVFSLKGHGIVHLTGYLIKDDDVIRDVHLQSKNLNDSIMLAKDKVKSAGESSKIKKHLSTQNDNWKVESKAEIVTPAKKLFASPNEKNGENFQTNITGILEGDNWNVESAEDKNSPIKNNASPAKKSLSVSPSQNTPQKKLFQTSKEESEDSSEFEEEEEEDDDDEDEEETSSEDDSGEDAQQLLRFAQKRPISSLDELDEDDDDDEDDEDFEIDDSSDESDGNYVAPATREKNKQQSNKRLKAETSTPLPGKKTASKRVTEVIDIDDDSKNGDMDSSIGRTPMPKKKTESILQKSSLNNSKKSKPSKNEDSSDSDSEDDVMETSAIKVKETNKNKSVSQLETSSEAPTSEKKKKKKKKKKNKAEESTVANESNVSVNDSSFKVGGTKTQFSKKLQGGVEYEDIRLGNGPLAKKGKLVHVYYTGKLEDNEVFDSVQPAHGKPFVFKLGAGQVIKGWELAVEGMKTGGKRRIKIPPQMGYKNQRAGPIPPNSTLYFTIELKAVS